MRSEVFLPTPGIAVSRATSDCSMARTSSCGSMPDSTASASLGPMPLTPISRSNRSSSSARGEPVQRQRILADMSMDAQRDLAALVAEAIKRRKRHRDVVADAVHVDHDAIGLLAEIRPRRYAITGVPGGSGASSWLCLRPTHRRRGCHGGRAASGECTWQMATASASAASCGDGTAASRAAA